MLKQQALRMSMKTFKEIEEVDRRLHRRLNAEKLARAREDERLGGRPFDDL